MAHPPTPATRLPEEEVDVEQEIRPVERRRELPAVELPIRGFLVALALLAPALWVAFVVPLEAALLVAGWAGTFGLLVVAPLLALRVARGLLDR